MKIKVDGPEKSYPRLITGLLENVCMLIHTPAHIALRPSKWTRNRETTQLEEV